MINVLIVDDDAMVAELNRCYLNQLHGFQCCGIANSLSQATTYLQDPLQSIDLILLDVYIQHENGLDLLPIIRQTGRAMDVIMISSASDAETIKKSMHYGVVDYLIKPFQFARFEEALNHWWRKKTQLENHESLDQHALDKIMHGSKTASPETPQLPKGLTSSTMRTICQWIETHPTFEFSTDELACAVLISRVSCRKYLVWLTDMNILQTSIHYGVTGRPVYRYQLQAQQRDVLKRFINPQTA